MTKRDGVCWKERCTAQRSSSGRARCSCVSAGSQLAEGGVGKEVGFQPALPAQMGAGSWGVTQET